MLDSLFIAATGMTAEQTQIDTVANNLVNMNTMGFKKSQVAFETLMPQPITAAKPNNAQAVGTTSYLGMGVAGTNALIDFVVFFNTIFFLAIQGKHAWG